eukprot:gene7349-13080_t
MSSDERREEKDSDCDAFSEVLEYLPQCHSLTWADTESSETLPGASASLQHPSVFGPGQIPIQPREKDTHVSSVANKRKFTISEHIVRNVRARNVLTELYPRIRGVSLVEAAADLLTSREKAVFRKKLQESGMENENFRYKEICKLAACHSLTWADTESSETLPGASASLQHPSVFGPGQIPIQPREKDTHVSSVANKRKFTISEHIVRNVRARNVLTELYPRIRGVSLVEAAADLLTSREKAVFRKKLQESGMENENFRYKEICKLAAVSQRCFAQIMKIDEQLQNGEMKKSTSAQKISLSTFDFLQGEKEDEQYCLLSAIVNGEATLKHLNAEKRQRRRRVATEQPSTATTSSSAEGDMDALTFNSKCWKASEFSELNDQVRRLKGYIKTMKAELNDAEEEIRKNQRTIFNLEEEVKNVYDALKSRRTHFDEYRINVERRLQAKDKTIAELQSQLSSLTENCSSNLFNSRLLETNEMYNSTPEPKKLEEGNRKYTKSAFKALPFTDILEENSASTDASEMTSIIPGLQPFNLAFQKKKSLATVSTTAIDDDFEAYVAGSAELESSFAESEGDLCEESAAQGIELLQSLSFDYESDSEPSNDRKDKSISSSASAFGYMFCQVEGSNMFLVTVNLYSTFLGTEDEYQSE